MRLALGLGDADELGVGNVRLLQERLGDVDDEVGDEGLVAALELAPDLVAARSRERGVEGDVRAAALVGRGWEELLRMAVEIGLPCPG